MERVKQIFEKGLLATVRSKPITAMVFLPKKKFIPRTVFELLVSSEGRELVMSLAFAHLKVFKVGKEFRHEMQAGLQDVKDMKVIEGYLDEWMSKEKGNWLSLPKPRKGHARIKYIKNHILKHLFDVYENSQPQIYIHLRIYPTNLIYGKYNLLVQVKLDPRVTKEFPLPEGIEPDDKHVVTFKVPLNPDDLNDPKEGLEKLKEFTDYLVKAYQLIDVEFYRSLWTTVYKGKTQFYRKTTSAQSDVVQAIVKFFDYRMSPYELKLLGKFGEIDRFDYDRKIEILKELLGDKWGEFLKFLKDRLYGNLQIWSIRAFPKYLLLKEGMLDEKETEGVIYAK